MLDRRSLTCYTEDMKKCEVINPTNGLPCRKADGHDEIEHDDGSYHGLFTRRFKWTVEFEVDEVWIADGFNITDQRALDMLSNDLQFANIGTELGAKVLSAPDPTAIRKAQGYRD